MLGGEPLAGFPGSFGGLCAAFDREGFLEQVFPTPLGEGPGELLVAMRITELTIRGWPVAAATGQPRDLDPGLVAFADGVLRSRPIHRGSKWPVCTRAARSCGSHGRGPAGGLHGSAGTPAAARIIDDLVHWHVHSPAAADVLAAIDIHQRTGASRWDAMILRSAKELGCGTLHSEDLNSGQAYEGVQVCNPFLAQPPGTAVPPR